MDNREKILAAAREAFLKAGYEGARMRDIADAAGVNKGLLHYYFKTKRALFLEVLRSLIHEFYPEVDTIIRMPVSFLEKLELFIDKYIDMLSRNLYIPFFIVQEMNLNTDEFVSFILKSNPGVNFSGLLESLHRDIAAGKIREVNPFQLLLNIISLSIFPFVVRPGIRKLSGMSDEEFVSFMKLRKRVITETIINSLKL